MSLVDTLPAFQGVWLTSVVEHAKNVRTSSHPIAYESLNNVLILAIKSVSNNWMNDEENELQNATVVK